MENAAKQGTVSNSELIEPVRPGGADHGYTKTKKPDHGPIAH